MTRETAAPTQSTLELCTAAAAQVEQELDRMLREADLPENLRAAVRYAVLGGGKRLRPVLILLCCQAAGGRSAQALAAACAMELIHCFSLVHDDLPAMDDDALRRGQPTLHIHAGEAMAILAGDVMVSLAFEAIASIELEASRRARLVSELARATTAMIAGQVYDTLGGFAGDLPTAERLRLVHRNKTGALLAAACRMGGICAGADNRVLGALDRYGHAIGLMFQIVDDLLDVTQSAEHIGKATGKDQSAGKLTFPGVFGVERSQQEIQALRDAAHRALEPMGTTATPLRELCDLMAVRTK